MHITAMKNFYHGTFLLRIFFFTILFASYTSFIIPQDHSAKSSLFTGIIRNENNITSAGSGITAGNTQKGSAAISGMIRFYVLISGSS
jgi:hypothetical protein